MNIIISIRVETGDAYRFNHKDNNWLLVNECIFVAENIVDENPVFLCFCVFVFSEKWVERM